MGLFSKASKSVVDQKSGRISDQPDQFDTRLGQYLGSHQHLRDAQIDAADAQALAAYAQTIKAAAEVAAIEAAYAEKQEQARLAAVKDLQRSAKQGRETRQMRAAMVAANGGQWLVRGDGTFIDGDGCIVQSSDLA